MGCCSERAKSANTSTLNVLKSLPSHLPCPMETLRERSVRPDGVWRGNLDPTGRSFSPMDSFHKPSFLSSLQRRAVNALRGFRPVFMLASRLAQPLIYGGRLGSYQRFGRQTSTRQLDGCLRGSFFPTRIERRGGERSQRYNPTNHLVSTCVLAACPTKFTVMSLK